MTDRTKMVRAAALVAAFLGTLTAACNDKPPVTPKTELTDAGPSTEATDAGAPTAPTNPPPG